MQRYLYPSETQRSGFARERRSNEAIRSFRRKAETERAQFAPTRRWLSSSGCRRYDICFGKPAERRSAQSQSPCRNKPYPRLYPSRTQRSGSARKRRGNEAIRSFRRKAETERAQFDPTRPFGRRGSLPPQEGRGPVLHPPPIGRDAFRMTPPGGGGNPENRKF
jgi:hypothetical protein